MSTNYSKNTSGKPTFINLDKAYPKEIFTAVIWGRNRASFNYEPERLKGSSICVTGLMEEYKGKPQIEVIDPRQIIIND